MDWHELEPKGMDRTWVCVKNHSITWETEGRADVKPIDDEAMEEEQVDL
jgi:hypothetical protein